MSAQSEQDSPALNGSDPPTVPNFVRARIEKSLATFAAAHPKLAATIANNSLYSFAQHEKDLVRHLNETLKTGEDAKHINCDLNNSPIVGDINCQLASRTAEKLLTTNRAFDDLKLANRMLSKYLFPLSYFSCTTQYTNHSTICLGRYAPDCLCCITSQTHCSDDMILVVHVKHLNLELSA